MIFPEFKNTFTKDEFKERFFPFGSYANETRATIEYLNERGIVLSEEKLEQPSARVSQDRLRAAGIPPGPRGRFWEGFRTYDARLAPQCQVLLERVEHWATTFQHDALGLGLISTQIGCGKTHLAAAAARRLMERGFHVAWINHADMAVKIKETFGSHAPQTEAGLIENWTDTGVLFIDDFGVLDTIKGQSADRSQSTYFDQILYTVINSRAATGKPITITGNLSAREMLARAQERGAGELMKRSLSRLKEMLSPERFEFPLADFRNLARVNARN